ncbi:hypothetical protein [Alkalicoccus chagannorensis]|uniref:hypothetical protein n=1 Tax=Alkalicoccus chagannorensis TaxID=427072 RepID=UPI0004799EE6|nr:hypothetical protein [Alkalicoccus chagannorensis]
MLHGPPQKNRFARLLLGRWGYYDTNSEYLEEHEEKWRRWLYTALKELKKEDVAFLAAKYRHPVKEGQQGGSKLNDRDAAAQAGWDLDAYIRNRHRIETLLSEAITEKMNEEI